MSRNSSFDLATKLMAGRPTSRCSNPGKVMRVSSITSPHRLGAHPSFFTMGNGGKELHRREDDNSLTTSAGVKNGGASLSLPHTSSWRGAA
jgi:hypothetical protein